MEDKLRRDLHQSDLKVKYLERLVGDRDMTIDRLQSETVRYLARAQAAEFAIKDHERSKRTNLRSSFDDTDLRLWDSLS